MSTRQNLWQKRHRQLGLCVSCSEKAVLGGLCLKHYIKTHERTRLQAKCRRRNWGAKRYLLEQQLEAQRKYGKKKVRTPATNGS